MRLHVDTLQAIIRDARAKTGGDYHFVLTGGDEFECAVHHWAKPNDCAFSHYENVSHGAVAECIAALQDYAERYTGHGPRVMTAEDIGMLPVRSAHPMAAE